LLQESEDACVQTDGATGRLKTGGSVADQVLKSILAASKIIASTSPPMPPPAMRTRRLLGGMLLSCFLSGGMEGEVL